MLNIPKLFYSNYFNNDLIMNQPVIYDDGFTYEKELIENFLKTNNNISPITGETISDKIINKALINEIIEFIKNHDCLSKQYIPKCLIENFNNLILSDNYDLISDNNDFRLFENLCSKYINNTKMFSLIVDKYLTFRFDQEKFQIFINKLLQETNEKIIFEYFSCCHTNETMHDIIINYCKKHVLIENLIKHLITENNLDKIKFIFEDKKINLNYNHLEFALKNNNIEVSNYLIGNNLNDYTKMKLNETEYKIFKRINKKIVEHEHNNLLLEIKKENEILKNKIIKLENKKSLRILQKNSNSAIYKYNNNIILLLNEKMIIYDNQMNLIDEINVDVCDLRSKDNCLYVKHDTYNEIEEDDEDDENKDKKNKETNCNTKKIIYDKLNLKIYLLNSYQDESYIKINYMPSCLDTKISFRTFKTSDEKYLINIYSDNQYVGSIDTINCKSFITETGETIYKPSITIINDSHIYIESEGNDNDIVLCGIY